MHTKIWRRLAPSPLLRIPLGIGTKCYAGPAAKWTGAHAGGLLYVIALTIVVNLLVPYRAAGGCFS